MKSPMTMSKPEIGLLAKHTCEMIGLDIDCSTGGYVPLRAWLNMNNVFQPKVNGSCYLNLSNAPQNGIHNLEGMGEAPRCCRDQPSTHVAFPAKVPKHLLEGSYKDHNHIILLFFVDVSLNLFVGQTNFGKRVIKETCEAPENPHQEEEQIPFKEKIPD